ncbi:MAG: carbohydrate ABC transporter permease [Spirochaetia bacterium]|nr:carbohydrate ABC transporter permease [Spirochaetia bacterium]
MRNESYVFIKVKQILGWGLTIVMGSTMIVPFLWMISTSLKPDTYLLVFPPRFFEPGMSLQSYYDLFSLFPMAKMFINSVIVAVSATLGQLIFCSMAAFAFSRIPFKGREALFLLFLGTLMIPMQVIITPLFIEMRYLGWVNTYAGIIFPTMTMRIAFGVFLMRQAFNALPAAIEESAVIDGANPGIIFIRIGIPLVKSSLATLSVLAFMDSWNAFLWPLLVIRDTNMMTLPLGLANLHGRYTTEWNMVMAGAVISVLPIIIWFAAAQKQFIEGVSRSGIKG